MPDQRALESTFDLIARVREGDKDSLERLMDRHLRPLRRWASGRLPAWARQMCDTDDLVQDALLKTFTRLEAFDAGHGSSLQAYLRTAVLNRLRDELRRTARVPGMVDAEAAGLSAGTTPLEEAIGHETYARYQAALARLRPEEREAIVGRVEMDYSYADLAAILGKPTADAARKTAQRALLRLAEEMMS